MHGQKFHLICVSIYFLVSIERDCNVTKSNAIPEQITLPKVFKPHQIQFCTYSLLWLSKWYRKRSFKRQCHPPHEKPPEHRKCHQDQEPSSSKPKQGFHTKKSCYSIIRCKSRRRRRLCFRVCTTFKSHKLFCTMVCAQCCL